MPSPPTTELPRPKGWDEFEDLVADVLRERWKTPNVTRNGRSGQRQAGVDIYGPAAHLAPGQYAGAQCKRTDGLDLKVAEECVSDAESFEPALSELLICTTAPADAKVQRAVRLLDQKRAQAGQFRVFLLFWEDIALELSGHRKLLAKHFPGWSRLGPHEEEPQLSLLLTLTSGESADGTRLSAVPNRLRNLGRVVNPFSETELGAADIAADDAARARRYNEEVRALLAVPENRDRWVRQNASTRYEKHGVPLGVVIENERATASDVLVTLTFPEGFEVWEADEPPRTEVPLKVPERPVIGAAARLMRQYTQQFALPAMFREFAVPSITLPSHIPTKLTLRHVSRLRVEDGAVSLRLDRIAPRRRWPFTGEDGLRVAPPCQPGVYEVRWEIDAENLSQPVVGSLKLVVEERTA
ncbi:MULTISPECIES: hypothetical protein [unclassified Corallococcus]|uniref:hypothetical protein n=1 Tax=unclassified Corallococcus TaxID=2685029 RepID=UPI001A8ED9DD|nr:MULTISPECIES: hypothetical protein [unclassified Corallococcus]MBN9686132.1 hypothetical protein [Corallococcus sp. NCSPR001]WAS82433.1 hypothetical protein O0N60_24245 [Corallococcus sp. NCRR]